MTLFPTCICVLCTFQIPVCKSNPSDWFPTAKTQSTVIHSQVSVSPSQISSPEAGRPVPTDSQISNVTGSSVDSDGPITFFIDHSSSGELNSQQDMPASPLSSIPPNTLDIPHLNAKFYIDSDNDLEGESSPASSPRRNVMFTIGSEELLMSKAGLSPKQSLPVTPQPQPILEVPTLTNCTNPAVSIVRLYLMAYFPCGFWPRLITRLLADESISSIMETLYDLPPVLQACKADPQVCQATGVIPEWRCWQTGLELLYLGSTVIRIREVSPDSRWLFCDYRQCCLLISQEHQPEWSQLNTQTTSILELILPNETISVQTDSGTTLLQPRAQAVAALLSHAVDHLDTLLEDWYPDLGARFVQNAHGMYLITRVVPCLRCMLQQVDLQKQSLETGEAWSVVEVNPADEKPNITQPIVITRHESSTSVGTPQSSVGGGFLSSHSGSLSSPASAPGTCVGTLELSTGDSTSSGSGDNTSPQDSPTRILAALKQTDR